MHVSVAEQLALSARTLVVGSQNYYCHWLDSMGGSRGGGPGGGCPTPSLENLNFLNLLNINRYPIICLGHPPPSSGNLKISVGPPTLKNVLDARMDYAYFPEINLLLFAEV